MRAGGSKASYESQVGSEDSNPSISTLLLKSIRRPRTEEVEELYTYFEQRNNHHKDYVDRWFELQESTFSKFEKFKSDFSDQRSKASGNNAKFMNNVDSNTLLKRDFTLDIESELKEPELEQIISSDWFQQFKKQQSSIFNTILHEIAKKVVNSRFTKVQQEQRKNLEDTIDKQTKAIEKCKSGRGGDKINPYFKHHLADLITSIHELQRLDNNVPKILKDLQSRPKEYVKDIVPTVKDFALKLQQIAKDFENNTFKDAGNRNHYATIDREQPDRIRASKYGINIANRDLATLKVGRVVHPIITNFLLQFLKEKSVQLNLKLGENERLYINENIIDVYRGESILLAELGKEGGNLLKSYKRLGFIMGVDDKHLIFVEVRKTDDDLRKELIIYNSDIEKYQMFHSKIHGIFRSCLGLEEPDRVGASTGFRATETRGFLRSSTNMRSSFTQPPKSQIAHVLDLRVANCPQQVNPFDGALYANKNATLMCLGKKIMQGIYSQNDINQFRYEMFNLILKLGNEIDVEIYDLDT